MGMLLRRITQHVKEQNWLAVCIDFVIVVIGVGVALFAQQWMSDRQQLANLVEAEAALQGDLGRNYFNAKERIAVATCRIESYQALGEQLLAADDSWTANPRDPENALRQALPAAFRSPSRGWGSNTWETELARGTLNRMPDVRRRQLDSVFRQSEHAQLLQREIWTLQGQLKPLAAAKTIGQSDRLHFYSILGELDEKSALLEHISVQIIENIEEVGIDMNEVDQRVVSDAIADFGVTRGEIYGPCFELQNWPALQSPF